MSIAEPTASDASVSAEAPLPLNKIVAWSASSIGLTAMAFVNSLYLFKYCTDELYIPLGMMGLLYGLSRIWDAITDPLVGRMSDQTSSSFGRRRSWIFASIPVVGIAFVMLWAPPSTLSRPCSIRPNGASRLRTSRQ